MTAKHLSTSIIARQVGCHPNTVRMYEQWGFISPVPRSPAGYRLFTGVHLEQMRLARMLFNTGWCGKLLRRSALSLVRQTASGDFAGALVSASCHLTLVRAEIAQAESAAHYVQSWVDRQSIETGRGTLFTREAASLLNVTVDTLRTWERSGLVHPPRAANGYRLYGPAEIGRLRVIRLLRNAGYSTMAILRMVLHLDRGNTRDLKLVLDTPRPDEDVLFAADRWLSTLADQEQRALTAVTLLESLLDQV